MQKTSFATLLALLLLIAGCSKQSDTKPGVPASDGPRYAVNFDVSGIDVSQGSFNGRAQSALARTAVDSAQNAINHLYYYIFPADTSVPVHMQHHLVSDANFQRFTDSLPAGVYRITVVASHDPLTLQHSERFAYMLIPLPGGDLFAKSYTLNVSGAVTQSIPLERQVAKFHLVINDQLPFSAGRVGISFEGSLGKARYNVLGYDGSLFLDVFCPTTAFFNVKPEEQGQTGFTRDLYLLSGDSTTFLLNVLVEDVQQKVITMKSTAVTTSRNNMVTLKATLFNGFPTDTGVSVLFPTDTTFKNGGTVSF